MERQAAIATQVFSGYQDPREVLLERLNTASPDFTHSFASEEQAKRMVRRGEFEIVRTGENNEPLRLKNDIVLRRVKEQAVAERSQKETLSHARFVGSVPEGADQSKYMKQAEVRRPVPQKAAGGRRKSED